VTCEGLRSTLTSLSVAAAGRLRMSLRCPATSGEVGAATLALPAAAACSQPPFAQKLSRRHLDGGGGGRGEQNVEVEVVVVVVEAVRCRLTAGMVEDSSSGSGGLRRLGPDCECTATDRGLSE